MEPSAVALSSSTVTHAAVVGARRRNSPDNMKVMLVAKGRRLVSVGRDIADPSVF